jgi:hypothetical protein
MPIGAMAGATVIGAGASIISGNKAAKATEQASAATVAENRRQYDLTRADFAPWRDVGGGALSKLAGMFGVAAPGAGSATSAAAPYGGFFESPGYRWQLDQGVQAAERSAASRGLLRSGAAIKAITRYGEGLAASDYNSFADRLSQIAGLGQAATGQTAAAGAQSAALSGQALMNAGNTRASSYLNTGNAISSGVGNMAAAYLYGFGR